MSKALRTLPPLPIEQPAGDKWEARIIAITGRFALSVRRRGQTCSNAAVAPMSGQGAAGGVEMSGALVSRNGVPA